MKPWQPRLLTVEVRSGVVLSGIIAEPVSKPRALVIALHGHGMHSGYFAGPADANLSLLELGAVLGYTVWAPDRPGYGSTAKDLHEATDMFRQAELLNQAIETLGRKYAIGAGYFVIGHSYGFKLALTMASLSAAAPLLGIDGSGSGLMYSFRYGEEPPPAYLGDKGPSWGPAELYPPRTFDRGVLPVLPGRSAPPEEGKAWPDDFRRIAPAIRVPVRFTFGNHERLWMVNDEHFDALRALLCASPRVEVHVQRGAGHNVSLSQAARAYHLKAFAFAEECLLGI